MYSLMSMRVMASSSSNMNSARARASSVLPTPVGPEEQERADRPVRILEAGAGAADRVGHGLDGLVLPDDPLVQALLHVDELRRLAFHQAADRDPGPGRHDVGDVVRPDLLLEQGARALEPARVASSVTSRSPSSLWVPYLSSAAVAKSVSRSACSIRVASDSSSDFVVRIAAIADFSLSQRCFMPPATSSRSASSFSSSVEPGLRGVVGLLAQGLSLDLELDPAPLELVELDGHRVDLHAQPRGRLIDEVDGLVGQEPVGDVAVRQRRGGDERGVRDADAVMDLVALAQAAQDRDRLLDRRLVHEDRLEAPLEGRVLLDVLAVLVEGGGADRVQLPAGEHRLEQVGGVHGAFRRAGTDDRVELVDEQDDLALGVLDLLEDGLEPLLELAAELGPGDERAEVQRDDALVLERLGHVAADDPLGEALGDGRLADARLADEDRVVLRPARQDLDDAADLVVPPDDRVELAGARLGREVAAVLLERRVRAFGIRRRHALAAADALERAEDGLLAGAVALEQGLGLATDLGRADEQVLGRDVVVAEATGLVLGPIDDALGAWIQAQRTAGDAGPASERGGQLAAERGQVHAEPSERLGRDAVIGLDEGVEQVFGIQDRTLESLGGGLRGHDGFLGLLGESVELHVGLSGADQRGDGWSMRVKRAAAAVLASSDRSVGRITFALA